MIIVTGTKRSGTSMWMQILKAAGYPSLGEAFPYDWGETIKAANQAGFHESSLRHGIYYATNPDPRSGAFLPPQRSRRVAIKVFAMGLVRTDLAYVDRVIASMRSWREYAPSLERLLELELENKRAQAQARGLPAESVLSYAKLPPALEWWRDNYGLIRDALVRRYPLHMVSYDAVLRSPEQVIPETLRWLGAGDVEAAIEAVRGELRTQHEGSGTPVESGVTAAHEALFDELYARIDERRPLDGELIDRLNAAHDVLSVEIAELEAKVRLSRKQARQREKSAEAIAHDDASDSS